jgi:hypothetical protein
VKVTAFYKTAKNIQNTVSTTVEAAKKKKKKKKKLRVPSFSAL